MQWDFLSTDKFAEVRLGGDLHCFSLLLGHPI